MVFALMWPGPARPLRHDGPARETKPRQPALPGRHQRVVTTSGREGSDHNLTVHYSR